MARTPTNRLAGETSPYLIQHASNPVDWYPWGEEALGRAKREDRPILLSIGYAACHWCHVMERESFEDPETARVMNERFISVKVDREERPDLDTVYMSAVQAMTGHGGWPMTVFLTPDGTPFYGGTYFPPEDRHGMPSFRRVLDAVWEAWSERRAEVERQGGALAGYIANAAAIPPSGDPLREDTLTEALRAMAHLFDAEWGGFGDAPKFPQPASLEFLLRMHARGAPDALPMLRTTLDRMARGGVFDQAGGGFHRYSVDRLWLVPHFEKMLYDNAQLVRLYARAWLVAPEPLWRRASLASAEWLLREMRHPAGGFFSALDADSEGEEGRFYVWDLQEFLDACGADAAVAGPALGVLPAGNWEGRNVLWRPREDAEVASDLGIAPEAVTAALDRVRPRLLQARADRERPRTDDKILAGWNGLTISGLAEAGRAFDRPDLVEAAGRAADFVLGEMRDARGRLQRAWRDGRTSGPGFLEDYALTAAACLDLYETTFETRWFDEAESLARTAIALFADGGRGGFFDTGTDVASPFVRPKDVFDNAVPSGNSVMAETLLRLAALTGDAELERAGAGPIRIVHQAMGRSPLGFGHALGALDLYVSRAHEIAVVGDLGSEQARGMIRALHERYIPNRVLAAGPAGSERPALLRDRPSNGGATAYVCRDFACDRPAVSVEDLLARLQGEAGPG